MYKFMKNKEVNENHKIAIYPGIGFVILGLIELFVVPKSNIFYSLGFIILGVLIIFMGIHKKPLINLFTQSRKP